MVNNKYLIFETNKYLYKIEWFEIIILFAKNIFGGKIILNNTDADKSNLLIKILEFKKNTKTKELNKKQSKNTLKSLNALYKGREMVLNDFKSGILP